MPMVKGIYLKSDLILYRKIYENLYKLTSEIKTVKFCFILKPKWYLGLNRF